MNDALIPLACAVAGYILRMALEQLLGLDVKPKEIPDDSLVAEAYSLCDVCQFEHQRNEFRDNVDSYVRRILEAQKENAKEAERHARRLLTDWVQARKMGR